MVGINQNLNTDCEIASFLLHLYNKPDRKLNTNSIACINCKKIISVALCPECALTCTSGGLSDNKGHSRNRKALPADALSSIEIKMEKDDYEGEEHLTIHFENASKTATIQKKQPEKRLLQAPCRRSIRKLSRKPRYTAADKNDKDYEPQLDESSDSSSGSRTPSPKPRVIRARLGRPPKTTKTTGKTLPSTTAMQKDQVKTQENDQKHNNIISDNNVEGDTCGNAEIRNDQVSDEGRDDDCQNAGGGRGQRLGRNESAEGDKVVRGKQQRKMGEFPCDVCGSVFKEAYLQRRHKRIHSSEHGKGWQYKCDECKRPFRQKGLYDAHMRMHSGTKLFVCGACDADFAVSKQLKRHVQAQHSDVMAAQACYKCSLCQSAFGNYKKYSNHMYRHTLHKNHICEICSKAFSEPSLLVTHMRVHTDERPFTCPECGHSFRQVGSLTTHMQRHRGEKNYGCHLCPMKYYSKHQLKMHLAAHKGEKSYLCQLCGAGYTNSKSLQVHMRSHTGERPFKCEVCGKDFARPSSYKQHVLIHTNVRPFSCYICSMTFKDNSNFRRHHHLKHAGQERRTRTGRPKGGPPPVPRSTDIARSLLGEAGHGGPRGVADAAANPLRNLVKEETPGSGYGDPGERDVVLLGRAALACEDSDDSSLAEGGMASKGGSCDVQVVGSKSALDCVTASDSDSRLVVDTDQLQQTELNELLGRQEHYPVHYQY